MEVGLTYEQMKGMNNMWKQYIKILLDQSIEWAKKDLTVSVLEKVREGVCQHLVKADLNGVLIEVVNANNKQLIGIKGIVAKETKRAFVIISEDEKQRTILKEKTVFKVPLPYDNFCVNLWGDMLLHKGYERTKAGFKERGSLSLY